VDKSESGSHQAYDCQKRLGDIRVKAGHTVCSRDSQHFGLRCCKSAGSCHATSTTPLYRAQPGGSLAVSCRAHSDIHQPQRQIRHAKDHGIQGVPQPNFS
jgi:hypothetical protein